MFDSLAARILRRPQQLRVVVCGQLGPLAGLLLAEGRVEGVGGAHERPVLLALLLGLRILQQGEGQLLLPQQHRVRVVHLHTIPRTGLTILLNYLIFSS